MKIRPLHDNVLVELVEESEKTKSGIYIPDNKDKEKAKRGIVVSVGTGKINDKGERNKMDVKAGDNIFFEKYFSENDYIKINDKNHLIVKEEEILAIEE